MVGKARSWDAVGLATVGCLGVLGVRRRQDPSCHVPSLVPKITSLEGVRCIVTGASSGMGAEIAWALVEAGADEVLMACRSLERCEAKRQELFRRCTSDAIGLGPAESQSRAVQLRAARRRQCMEMQRKMVCKVLDLTSANSIQEFVKDTEMDKPVILVNNAGVMTDSEMKDVKEQAVDLQLRTNHYGHFMLTQLLLPSMDPTSIIVIMASRAHRQGSLTVENALGDVEGDPPLMFRLLNGLGLGWYARYARSKLCNVLFAAELRRQYPEGPVSVAISPGLVNTGIFRSVPEPLGQVLRWLADKSFQRPQEGAQHILNAISATQEAQRNEEMKGFPLYWHCSKPQDPSKAAMDQSLAAALWRSSEVAVKKVL